jgi:acetoacetate decarboxylase
MLNDFKGYGSPQTRRGLASPYGPPPWHMSGRVMTVWFRVEDLQELRNHIAPPLTVPDDALCRARFWELTHDAGQGNDLPAHIPAQTHFHEAVLAIDASYNGTRGDYSIHIYADEPTYTAWAREVIGWPVKMGQVAFSEPWNPQRLAPADKLTGTLARFGTQLLRASVTLKRQISPDERPYRVANWFTYKVIPSVEKFAPEVSQLVLVQPSTLDSGPLWEAEGTVEIGVGLNDELHFLRPKEIVWAEYWSYVNLSVGYGKILARL